MQKFRTLQEIEGNISPFISFPTEAVNPFKEVDTVSGKKSYRVYCKNLLREWKGPSGSLL